MKAANDRRVSSKGTEGLDVEEETFKFVISA